MIMTHICACVLFVLMCGTSDAALTVTLPTGSHSGSMLIPRVKYNVIKINDPIRYDPSTGRYTVQNGEDGTYLVSVTMMSGTVTGHTNIMKNDDVYVWLYTGNQYDMATQTVCMELKETDYVSVKMAFGPILFDVYNTFTVVKVLG